MKRAQCADCGRLRWVKTTPAEFAAHKDDKGNPIVLVPSVPLAKPCKPCMPRAARGPSNQSLTKPYSLR